MIPNELVTSLVGKTEADAHTAAMGFDVQVTRRDDEVFMGDMMMNDNRVKIEIEKGIVVLAIAG